MPEMMDVYESNPHYKAKYNRTSVENSIGGLSISSSGIGEMLGPLVSSYMC